MPSKKQQHLAENAARRLAADTAPITYGPPPAFRSHARPKPKRRRGEPHPSEIQISLHALERLRERLPATIRAQVTFSSLVARARLYRQPPNWTSPGSDSGRAGWWMTAQTRGWQVTFPITFDQETGRWVAMTCLTSGERRLSPSTLHRLRPPLKRGARAGNDWAPFPPPPRPASATRRS